MDHHWHLKGRLRIAVLGRGLLLFESLSEAEWVLARGKRRIKENFLHLERWNPEVACIRKGAHCHRMLQMTLPRGLYRRREASGDSWNNLH